MGVGGPTPVPSSFAPPFALLEGPPGADLPTGPPGPWWEAPPPPPPTEYGLEPGEQRYLSKLCLPEFAFPFH